MNKEKLVKDLSQLVHLFKEAIALNDMDWVEYYTKSLSEIVSELKVEQEKRIEGWDNPVILQNFKEMCDKAGNPYYATRPLVSSEVSEIVIIRLLKHAGYENSEEIIDKIKGELNE